MKVSRALEIREAGARATDNEKLLVLTQLIQNLTNEDVDITSTQASTIGSYIDNLDLEKMDCQKILQEAIFIATFFNTCETQKKI
jgi:hypothetical protein